MTLAQVISYLEKQDNEAARGPLRELRWCINQGYAHRIDFGNIVFYECMDSLQHSCIRRSCPVCLA